MMKCKTNNFKYITLAVALSFSSLSDSYAGGNSNKWSSHSSLEGWPVDPFGAAAPTACPQLTSNDIFQYAINPAAAVEFHKYWIVTPPAKIVLPTKEEDIISPHVECSPDGTRHISYKVKSGHAYEEQTAIASPIKTIEK